jgi:hypothetical protein
MRLLNVVLAGPSWGRLCAKLADWWDAPESWKRWDCLQGTRPMKNDVTTRYFLQIPTDWPFVLIVAVCFSPEAITHFIRLITYFIGIISLSSCVLFSLSVESMREQVYPAQPKISSISRTPIILRDDTFMVSINAEHYWSGRFFV